MMSLGDAAARLGVPVFPCGDHKRPITEHGFKDAVTEEGAIRALFRAPGASLIGVPTGEASGLIVVDIDVRDGRLGMDWLNLNSEALPPTRTHKTRSGGLHLVFQYPEGHDIRNSASRVAPGVDIRGNGGYACWPPSPGYVVADPAEPAEMPRWLIRACGKPEPAPQPTERITLRQRIEGGTPYGLAGLNRECGNVTGAADGQKHHALNKAAYSVAGLVACGELDEGAARAALRDAVEAIRGRCEDFAAAERTLKDAFDAGLSRPRTAPERRPTASAEPPPNMHFDQAYYDSLEAAHGRDEEPILEPGSEQPRPEPPPHRDSPPQDGELVWGKPIDFFTDQAREPPQLQPDHVPDAIYYHARDLSERMGVDPTSVALCDLVASASVMTDDWRVQPKRFDYTWTEQPRLWAAIVGAPSILKSPVIAASTAPIDKLEVEARRRYAEAMRTYKRKLKEFKKAKDDEGAQEPVQPQCDRYMVEGTTTEAISEVLRDDDEATMRAPMHKVLCRQDELSEFFGNLDRYKSGGKGGGDRGAYLRLFNGGRYTVDRVIRGNFSISNWSANFLGGIQPAPMQRIG